MPTESWKFTPTRPSHLPECEFFLCNRERCWDFFEVSCLLRSSSSSFSITGTGMVDKAALTWIWSMELADGIAERWRLGVGLQWQRNETRWCTRCFLVVVDSTNTMIKAK